MTAVAGWRVTAEQRNAMALSAREAGEVVDELHRGSFDGVPIVGALFKIATGRQPHPMGRGRRQFDAELAEVKAAISEERLLVFRGWSPGDEQHLPGAERQDGGTPEQKLVRKAMGDRAAILFEDDRYRLVPARLWSEAGQGGFRIVALAEARSVVGRLAKRPASAPGERALWEEIAARLSDDRHGDGLFLLRHRRSGGSVISKSSEPAVTPSQLKPKVEEKDWFEVRIRYSDGQAFDGKCSIELPGGRKSVGAPGPDGRVRIDPVDSGACNVTLPDLDSAMWSLA